MKWRHCWAERVTVWDYNGNVASGLRALADLVEAMNSAAVDVSTSVDENGKPYLSAYLTSQ